MGTLILIRHGQSQWNLENRFTGWSDVPLTEQGRKDAVAAAKTLASYQLDLAFTSRLVRANDTLTMILEALDQTLVPVLYDSALNERHYGDLQGLNKAETAEKYGTDQVQLWRRSYTTRPPGGESIEDCVHRTLPFYKQYIVPHLNSGKTIIVAAHGNSLRPLIQHLDHLDDDTTATLEIGLCTPYVYSIDSGKVVKKEVIEVPGIVTKGASLTEKKVEGGKV